MRFTEWSRTPEGRYQRQVVVLPLRRRLVQLAVDAGCWRGHHWLCDPPSWAYDVGVGGWREWPERRANLGNLWWALGSWCLRSRPVPDARQQPVDVSWQRVPRRVRRTLAVRQAREDRRAERAAWGVSEDGP